MHSDSPLTRLPAELVLSIFCALPSFSDVAWFATTCRRHHQIWVNYCYFIYRQVAPRKIPCRKYARVLLSDQGGPPASATHLAFHEVLQLIRNAAVAEQSIADFERNHIKYVRGTNKRHEPWMSHTERIRFIRGLYQLWSLLLLDPETRKYRIRSMKLKDLMVVRDFSTGHGVCIPDPAVLALEGGDFSLALVNVYVDIVPHLDQLVSDLYGHRPGSWYFSLEEGYRGCITVWDSYYAEVKYRILERPRGRPCPTPEVVWYDTSDDDQIEWRQEADDRKAYSSRASARESSSSNSFSSDSSSSDSSSSDSSSTSSSSASFSSASSSRAFSRSSNRSNPFSDRFNLDDPFSDTQMVDEI